MNRPSLARLFWTGAAATLVVAALVALLAVVRGNLSETDARILGSLAALLFAGGTALSGLALLDHERGRESGTAAALASVVALALMLWGIWAFAFDGGTDTAANLAWSAGIILLAVLMTTTGQLLAVGARLRGLALLAGAVSGAAATVSAVGVWVEPESDAYLKVVVTLWILGVLGYFLVPVLDRWTSVGATAGVRVLATLDGVELIAGREPLEGGDGIEVVGRARAGERLALRRRHTGV